MVRLEEHSDGECAATVSGQAYGRAESHGPTDVHVSDSAALHHRLHGTDGLLLQPQTKSQVRGAGGDSAYRRREGPRQGGGAGLPAVRSGAEQAHG